MFEFYLGNPGSEKFQSVLFFLIAYASPFSLQIIAEKLDSAVPAIFPVEWLTLFLVLMTAIVFWVSFLKKEYGLLSLNILALNAIVFVFLSYSSIPSLAILALGFLAHLGMGIFVALRGGNNQNSPQIIHFLILQIATLPHIISVLERDGIPSYLQEYPGIVLLGFALFLFSGYMVTQAKNIKNTVTEVLLNTSIIVSAGGLFFEIEGKWTTIIFLAYSCAILWYGFAQRFLRTIAYGFIFLAVSLFKLYFVSPDIFESFSGSTAILLIGIVLTGLSYKFEGIKGVVLDIARKGREKKRVNHKKCLSK